MVDEELDVVIGQALGADDVIQVSAHEMRHEVDLVERLQSVSVIEGVEQANNILVIHVLQQPKFAESSLRCKIRTIISLTSNTPSLIYHVSPFGTDD